MYITVLLKVYYMHKMLEVTLLMKYDCFDMYTMNHYQQNILLTLIHYSPINT